MELHGRLAQIAELTSHQRDQMFDLMQLHYDGLRRDIFDSDMNEKRWAIVLNIPQQDKSLDSRRNACWTSRSMGVRSRPYFPAIRLSIAAWGQQELTRIWGNLALDLIDQPPDAELYWFLIAKGYETYRFLPVFFQEFYPRFDAEIPGRIKQVRDALSRARYSGPMILPAESAPACGYGDSCRLRPDIAQLTKGRLRDPHIRFF